MHPSWQLRESEVSDAAWLMNRRRLLLGAGMAVVATGQAQTPSQAAPETPTPMAEVQGYNNYYEFSTDKKAVRVLAQALTLQPWTVEISGEVEQPQRLDMDDLRRLMGSEERIYRLRCVEGWSAVIPWSGFALSRLLARARPTSRARYVVFESLVRRSEMIGQRTGNLPWPYTEGLRIDEAMHPLCFAVTGMYGQALAPQNGAPLRMAVPWKYGFKSPKAVVAIRLQADPPATSWNRLSPSEYGFYGNVNPEVPHPRWSQARENRMGELRKRPTLPFNGYADQVAALYAGQDPRTLF